MGNGAGRHEAVVIGAGQAGLAAAYYLAKSGIDYQVIEAADRVGDVWRRRYDSLRLYSPASGDALPGLKFPLPDHAFPTGQQMGDYLEAYAAHHRLAVRTGTRVTGLRAAADDGQPGGFELSTSTGRIATRQVVVATGAFQKPRIPEFAGELDPKIRQLHAFDYRGPDQLAPGPVLVVGLSHSGADIGHEAAVAGHPTFLSGKAHGELPVPIDSVLGRYVAWPLMRFVFSRLITLRTPIGRKMAPEVRKGGALLLRVRRRELRAAGVDLREERTTGVSEGMPQLADGSRLEVANVIWCTGYGRDYSWIDLPLTFEGEFPQQDRGVTSVPGLYIMGVPFLYSFASMLVTGTAKDARHIVEQIVRRSPRKGQRLVADPMGAG